jgi:hypothetical protein
MKEITTFQRWRRHCGLNKAEAARALGKSWHHVQRLERGVDYNGRITRPPKTMLLLMAAIAQHGVQRPWPE